MCRRFQRKRGYIYLYKPRNLCNFQIKSLVQNFHHSPKFPILLERYLEKINQSGLFCQGDKDERNRDIQLHFKLVFMLHQSVQSVQVGRSRSARQSHHEWTGPTGPSSQEGPDRPTIMTSSDRPTGLGPKKSRSRSVRSVHSVPVQIGPGPCNTDMEDIIVIRQSNDVIFMYDEI